MVQSVDGAESRQLTTNPLDTAPAWSLAGEYIAFLTDRTGGWEIWVMKANGSAQAPLFGAALDGLTLDYAFAGERAIDWAR
jgi:Tol biopolymer transport system component